MGATPLGVSIAATIASLLLLFGVLELVRRRRLREKYALLWIVTAVVLLVVLLHYSTVISALTDRSVVLAQRVAILEQRLSALEESRRDRSPDA